MERYSKRRLGGIEYNQRFILEQECIKNSYCLNLDLYWILTLAYPNLFGTKRFGCCCWVQTPAHKPPLPHTQKWWAQRFKVDYSKCEGCQKKFKT
jgi:hypothetical protein